MVTMLGTGIAAPFITMGLAALALVVTAIHLLSVFILLAMPRMREPSEASRDRIRGEIGPLSVCITEH